MGDLDFADSRDSGDSNPGLKGFRRFRPGGLMGFRGGQWFLNSTVAADSRCLEF